MRERPLARQAVFNSFALPDEKSFGVYKALNDVYPSFAEKLFENNDLMRKIVMSGYNPMDILDYPICGRCETLAAYNGYSVKNGKRYSKCTCMRQGCGHTTINPVTLRVWMKDELKKKVPPEYIDTIEYAVDGIAAKMIQMHMQYLRKLQEDYSNVVRKKIVSEEKLKDVVVGSMEEKPKIEHLGLTDDPKLPKDRIEIQEDIQNEG